MEETNLNARFQAGPDFTAKDGSKNAGKFNILGMEITPDDSPVRGVTNRTGISGKTMIEQRTMQNVWAIGGGEGTTGGGTGGSEGAHGSSSAGRQEPNGDPAGSSSRSTGTSSPDGDQSRPGTDSGNRSTKNPDEDERPHVET